LAKKKAEKITIWGGRDMKLYKLDAGGDWEYPKAYFGFECILDDGEILAMGLGAVGKSGVDAKKKIPLTPAILGYGDGFSFKAELAASDPDQEKMFPAGIIHGPDIGENVASASIEKENVLRFSILVPLKDWDDFGQLREYVGQSLEVTIHKGVIEGEGQAEIA